jgi:hypothetical protein
MLNSQQKSQKYFVHRVVSMDSKDENDKMEDEDLDDEEDLPNPDVITKYKTASEIANSNRNDHVIFSPFYRSFGASGERMCRR